MAKTNKEKICGVDMIRIDAYGDYKSDWNGRAMKLVLDGITIWFSYSTPIAFRNHGGKIVATENRWGTTTGRHLNFLEPNKDRRVDADTFAAMLDATLSKTR